MKKKLQFSAYFHLSLVVISTPPSLSSFFPQKKQQKTNLFLQHPDPRYRKPEVQVQRQQYRQPDVQRGQSVTPVRRPFQLQRRCGNISCSRPS